MESTSHTQAKTKTTGIARLRRVRVGAGAADSLGAGAPIAATGASGGAARSASGSCDGVHGEREIDAYDEELDSGTQALSGVLKQLERENMQHMADAFTAALAADLIDRRRLSLSPAAQQ